MHGQKGFAAAQQICTLRNQFGQSARKAAFAVGKAMPARAIIRGNSGNTLLCHSVVLLCETVFSRLLEGRAVTDN
jgi:hypothetical protein